MESDTNALLHLLSMSPEGISSFPLPTSGTVTIGRSESADVVVLDPLASRHHARLYLAGMEVEIEDLGTSNGTRLGEIRLPVNQRIPVPLGTSITVGATVLLVQLGRQELERLQSHGRFEARLAAECAQRPAGELAVVRIHLQKPVPVPRVMQVLDLPPEVVVAARGPKDYELLITGNDGPGIDGLLLRIRAALRDVDPEAALGAARHPHDGTLPEVLLARASARLGTEGEGEARAYMESGLGMKRLLDLATRVAAGQFTVLIGGEPGAGKHVLARLIHRLSPRAAGPCLEINCDALTEVMLESTLFGHERAAFTGAAREALGLLESAAGGTLILCAVEHLPPRAQARLLRTLETREVFRLGGTRPRRVNVRLVSLCGGAGSLERAVEAGRFSRDLFLRLNGVTLQVPPLRERTDDVAPLARALLLEACLALGEPPPALSPEVIAALTRHDWPGNVRELKLVLERALMQGLGRQGREISVADLPTLDRGPASTADAKVVVGNGSANVDLRAIERQRIEDALAACAGNYAAAARTLGVARSTLYSRLKALGIRGPRPSST